MQREDGLELVQAVVAAATDKEGGGLEAAQDERGDVVDGRVAHLKNNRENEFKCARGAAASCTMATLSSSPQS
jgi:hypothetical protein